MESLVTRAATKYGFLRQEPELSAAPIIPSPLILGASELSDHAFVASPMASLQPDAYEADRALVVKLSEKLREIGFSKVYYPGENRLHQSDFNDSYLALSSELRQIRKCAAFVFHWPTAVTSSALFQLGYALALEKRILILVRNPADLPFLVRALQQLKKVSQCVYRDETHLVSLIDQHREDLFEVEHQ